jgi:hypothetical protein
MRCSDRLRHPGPNYRELSASHRQDTLSVARPFAPTTGTSPEVYITDKDDGTREARGQKPPQREAHNGRRRTADKAG